MSFLNSSTRNKVGALERKKTLNQVGHPSRVLWHQPDERPSANLKPRRWADPSAVVSGEPTVQYWEFQEPVVKPSWLEIGHSESNYTMGISKHYKSEPFFSQSRFTSTPLPLNQNKHFVFQSNEEGRHTPGKIDLKKANSVL